MFDRSVSAAGGDAHMSGASSISPARPLVGCHILIVEDEMILALDLSDIVGSFGCTCVVAGRIGKALQLIETQVFDAGILDLNLAGEPVYPVADALGRREIPYVIATGYGAEGVLPAYRSQPILAKPYTRHDVETALTTAIALKKT
jgi:CheY-like chemotaxis protein